MHITDGEEENVMGTDMYKVLEPYMGERGDEAHLGKSALIYALAWLRVSERRWWLASI